MPAWLIKGVGLPVGIGLLAGICIVALFGDALETDGVWLVLFLCVLVATLVAEIWRRVREKRDSAARANHDPD